MFRKMIAIAASTVALTAAANAADMYGPRYGGYKDGPVYAGVNWSGFYGGVNGGYGWSGNNQEVDNDSVVTFGGLSPSGGFGGGQIGYNWQGVWHPQLVLGIETDLQGAGISDRQFDGAGDVYKSRLDYFGTVRGRLGYAAGGALFYATGGFAYGGLKKYSDDFVPAQSYNGTATGYAVGGGIEYKIAPAWSVKAEYQYLNFGKNDLCGGQNCFESSVISYGGAGQKEDDYHTFRVGLNYHVGSGYDPLK